MPVRNQELAPLRSAWINESRTSMQVFRDLVDDDGWTLELQEVFALQFFPSFLLRWEEKRDKFDIIQYSSSTNI